MQQGTRDQDLVSGRRNLRAQYPTHMLLGALIMAPDCSDWTKTQKKRDGKKRGRRDNEQRAESKEQRAEYRDEKYKTINELINKQTHKPNSLDLR